MEADVFLRRWIERVREFRIVEEEPLQWSTGISARVVRLKVAITPN
jgi:hypothetical protein